MAEDPNVRKIVVGKDCYAKHCCKCQFMVKSEWSPKQGVKYGWIDVACCANGGKWIDDGQQICPKGVGWETRLGTEVEFDPSMFWEPYPTVVAEGLFDVKPIKKPWYENE